MAIKLKNIQDQVIVITGASSGIGLATAEEAARQGAKVVLAARSEETLDDVVARMKEQGRDAIAVTCDVSSREDVEKLARKAVETYGRIDTWVNNAGLGMWGRLDETSEEDARLLFDINFWGVVYGSLAALPYLKKQGGALINVGSEVSDADPPLLGMYSTTKHAVKGYTDALRVEVEHVDKAPVAITLIQPTAIDTPFPQHARNFTDKEPKLPSPVHEPKEVADAILEVAQKHTRAKAVGGMALMNIVTSRIAPGLADRMAAKQQKNLLHDDEAPINPEGALRRPSQESGGAGTTHGLVQ